MQPTERQLLAEFLRRQYQNPEGDVPLAEIGESAALHSIVDALVGRGLLRAGRSAGDFTVTEDGRLGLAGPLDVTLYTRAGCHLCQEAKAEMAPLLRRAGAALREIDIDSDPLLRSRYDFDVPVIFLGKRKVAKHRVDRKQFERQLEQAARGAPESSK